MRGQSLGRSRQMTLVWGVVLAMLGLIDWGPVLVAGLTIASITYGGFARRVSAGDLEPPSHRELARSWDSSWASRDDRSQAFLTPLAWTWYVLVGTIVTFAVGSLASMIANKFARRRSALRKNG